MNNWKVLPFICGTSLCMCDIFSTCLFKQLLLKRKWDHLSTAVLSTLLIFKNSCLIGLLLLKNGCFKIKIQTEVSRDNCNFFKNYINSDKKWHFLSIQVWYFCWNANNFLILFFYWLWMTFQQNIIHRANLKFRFKLVTRRIVEQ